MELQSQGAYIVHSKSPAFIVLFHFVFCFFEGGMFVCFLFNQLLHAETHLGPDETHLGPDGTRLKQNAQARLCMLANWSMKM